MHSSVDSQFDRHISIRSWYSSSISEFLDSQSDAIIGRLAKNCDFTLLQGQRDAWVEEIEILHDLLTGLTGSIYLEFNIPRMGRRIDAVIIVGHVVFVIEFKAGETSFERSAYDQVWDYALDLKNFHKASHSAAILPILVATGTSDSSPCAFQPAEDLVFAPISVHSGGLRNVIDQFLKSSKGEPLDEKLWGMAPYHPTPTIVEAARSLYAHHSVEAIARYDAGAKNLRITSTRVEDLVEQARRDGRKLICFVTGVPGAGKTLVGLNIATQRRDSRMPTHAVYLSGNGPLVAVLREALTRDEVERKKRDGSRVRKGTVTESVKAFIQNIHHFRDEALFDKGPPLERVVIFDEAQRAWNLRQTANFMRRKKGRPDFEYSEPEFLISYMDRHRDWAVVVCLVGGGQEINIGEAGIESWVDAVNSRFRHWDVYVSPRLTDSEYGAGSAIDSLRKRENTFFDVKLHLAVSMRSFRAEHVSSFVKTMLECDTISASQTLERFCERYPVAVTRNLNQAKSWVRDHARGTERYGLLSSSNAYRLKPHAIDVRVDVNPVHWFLNGKDDTRSSYYLEDSATEFQVQGLELDWSCVTWDGDLRFKGSSWSYHNFRGSRWCNVWKEENQRYLKNAYRVLLTRARQGMVIFVPPGDSQDHTRLPEFYDPTYRYLRSLGIPELR